MFIFISYDVLGIIDLYVVSLFVYLIFLQEIYIFLFDIIKQFRDRCVEYVQYLVVFFVRYFVFIMYVLFGLDNEM